MTTRTCINPAGIEASMADERNEQKTQTEPGDESNRRLYPRVSPDWLQCDQGEILDISLGGAMIKSKRKLRGNFAMRVWNFETGLVLQARVIWSNPVCFRHHEVGVHFQNVGKTNFLTLKNLLYPFGLPAEAEHAAAAGEQVIAGDGQAHGVAGGGHAHVFARAAPGNGPHVGVLQTGGGEGFDLGRLDLIHGPRDFKAEIFG